MKQVRDICLSSRLAALALTRSETTCQVKFLLMIAAAFCGLLPALGAQAQQPTKRPVASAAGSSAVPQQAQGTPAQAQPAAPGALGPKKPGIIRIGMALPKTDLGQGFQGPVAGETMRSLISQYLGGPKLEIVPLTALLAQQADDEAKEKLCDYVVSASITQKKGGGGLGFLKGASSMAGMIPMIGGAAGAAGAIAGAAASTAMNGAAGVAGHVKAKSEVAFEYQLRQPGNATPVLTNKSTAKAKTDGEDVITPLIEAAATSIVAEVSKQK